MTEQDFMAAFSEAPVSKEDLRAVSAAFARISEGEGGLVDPTWRVVNEKTVHFHAWMASGRGGAGMFAAVGARIAA